MRGAWKVTLILAMPFMLCLGLGSICAQPLKSGRADMVPPEQFKADMTALRKQILIKQEELDILSKAGKPDTHAIQAKQQELDVLKKQHKDKIRAWIATSPSNLREKASELSTVTGTINNIRWGGSVGVSLDFNFYVTIFEKANTEFIITSEDLDRSEETKIFVFSKTKQLHGNFGGGRAMDTNSLKNMKGIKVIIKYKTKGDKYYITSMTEAKEGTIK